MDPQKLTKAQKRELRKQEWAQKANAEAKKAQYKKIGIWVGVAILIFAAIFGVAMLVSSSPSTPIASNQTVPAKAAQEFSRGDIKSKVTLIEYGDYQCPACAQYEPLVNQLVESEGDKLHFVYRFFPLSNIHQNAKISAQAGFAANKQGKFWEMSKKLYDAQSEWAEGTNVADLFTTYAKDLGLDTQKFKSDMNSNEAAKFVTDSETAALSLGINSTPSFFLNGKLISPRGFDDFKKLIDDEFNKK